MAGRVWVIGTALLAGLGGTLLGAGAAWSADLALYEPVRLRADDAADRKAAWQAKGSHIKVFIPSLPYIYTSHSINAGLTRPANTEQGWDLDLAVAWRQVDDVTYDFSLREGVKFHDGTPFDADMVVLNMKHFKKKPLLFTKIDEVFDTAEKLEPYKVRFKLKARYGQFINDLVWIHFYSPAYLDKFGWNGKPTCPNLAEAGPYGLGPFMLTEGYVEGDRQTPRVELQASPHYWDKRYPRIRRVTVFTELDSQKAVDAVLQQEGEVDIAPIPFSRKVETMLSPHAKAISSPSTNNYAIHLNLRNGNPKLLQRDVRLALNQALSQANLLTFVFDGEGEAKPEVSAPGYPGVREAVKRLRPYSEIEDPNQPATQARLKAILNGLTLKVLTQDNFMFLWKGIEYQLGKVGVKLDYDITHSEKDVFAQLLTTNAKKNTKSWDMLIWGMDDWYYNHPWTVFLVYRTHNYWSTIFPDRILDLHIEDLFRSAVGTREFDVTTEKIMRHVYDNAYMLFVPAPNNVLAVNKEVIFTPYRMATIPLWEIEISKDHWSQRGGGAYPEALRRPVELVRVNRP